VAIYGGVGRAIIDGTYPGRSPWGRHVRRPSSSSSAATPPLPLPPRHSISTSITHHFPPLLHCCPGMAAFFPLFFPTQENPFLTTVAKRPAPSVVGSSLHVLVAVHAHTEIAPALHDLLAWYMVGGVGGWGGWVGWGGCYVGAVLPPSSPDQGGGAYLPARTCRCLRRWPPRTSESCRRGWRTREE
jgi:hypothetical protein